MKQSNSKKREITAALYLRLSREDTQEGESFSISNQKKLLTKSAKEKGYSNLLIFADDGVSGTTMEQPDFKRMIAEIEKGNISAVFVKDMSRLGRNYLKVGYYTEEFFPEHDIRFVAVSDGVDSDEGENEFNPFRNVMNEWYARDISKKLRTIYKLKGNAGEPIGQPVYGYIKDPNSKFWIIEPEASSVVKRVFNLFLDGLGTDQIADVLGKDKVLTILHYWKQRGINRPGYKEGKPLYEWSATAVAKILDTQEYCGDIINFKTHSKSYKLKKRLHNSEEDMAIFKDVHEPIIERSVFLKVQEMRKSNSRKKPTKSGYKSIFSGVLRCSDCGAKLNFHFNQKNHDIKYFNCTGNNARWKTCDKTHYIREDFLYQVVINEIKRLTKFAKFYEDEFVKILAGHTKSSLTSQRSLKEKELKKLKSRDKELDKLFERMYEDNVSGKIDDNRFARMSKDYTNEQAVLSEQIKSLSSELEKMVDTSITTESFIKTVRKYTRIKKLNSRIINEFISYIEIYHAEKVDGIKKQRIRIHWNCIGELALPDLPKIDENIVKMKVRQGVELEFQKAV